MALTNGAKAAIAAVVVGGAWLAFSGTASARPPYTKRIPVPGNDTPWDTMDEAICTCFEAGETESAALVACSLRRVYPEVPWPPQANDDESITRTWQNTGARVAAFLVAIANGENPCEDVIVVPDDPDAPPEPVPGDVVYDDVFDKGPGSFGRVQPGTNPTTVARKQYGLGVTEVGRIRAALACVATTGFNLLFVSRPQAGDDDGRGRYTNGKWYDIGPAWLPVNSNVRDIAIAGNARLHRQISWQGKAISGNPGRYFTPWYPPMTQAGGSQICTYSDPWDPRRNPPASVLTSLGWTLEEMKATFDANNP